MEIKQLKPAVVERDVHGEWLHPEYEKYLHEVFGDAEHPTEEQWAELFRYFNVQAKGVWLEDDVTSTEWFKANEDCDLSNWNPEAPEGFFLIAIHFTEDDAVATFAREIRECEVIND